MLPACRESDSGMARQTCDTFTRRRSEPSLLTCSGLVGKIGFAGVRSVCSIGAGLFSKKEGLAIHSHAVLTPARDLSA